MNVQDLPNMRADSPKGVQEHAIGTALRVCKSMQLGGPMISGAFSNIPG